MRSFLKTFLLVVLLAGSHGSDELPKTYITKGHFLQIVVLNFRNTVSRCYLVTPLGKEIDFTTDETLDNKYEFTTNSISDCIVSVKNLDEHDEGLWSLYAVMEFGNFVEQRNIAITRTDLSEENSNQSEMKEISSEETSVTSKETSKNESDSIVNSEEVASNDNSEGATKEETSEMSESSEEQLPQVPASKEDSPEYASSESSSSEEDNTYWLSDLQFITRTGLNVDINLPRISNTEECIFITPSGRSVKVDENDVSGVTVHSRSDYVSCRIVVGPMENSLLGQWTLCGSYIEDNVEHKRCQHANIVWRNTANPDSMWQTRIETKFDHVVYFGGTLSPFVHGSGTISSCHLITPDNEDLFVTPESDYPYIKWVQSTDACNIAIGPIEQRHLGAWTIYGTFNSAFGYNEVRLPMNLDLYNKNHPYEQAYNVTTLNPTQHVVNLGNTINVEVTSTGIVDVCAFIMPSGMTYFSTNHEMPTGVSFLSHTRVACRIAIGPITENMIGEWLLSGKFSNRDIFTEMFLSFTIIQEDPKNPIQEDRRVEYLTAQNIDTDIGASHRVVITQQWNSLQSCHIRTPEGLQYTIMEGFDIPGIQVETGSNVACGVVVVVSEDLIGSWTLIAREIRSSELIERRLPFNIHVEEFVDALPNEITITEGNAFHVRLANPTSLHSTCKLIGPDNEEAPLASFDERHIETCGFVVGSVDAEHSGTWNIVYGTTIIYKAPVLVNVNGRSQPNALHLTWLEHSSVIENIGPEEAVYCSVISPRDVVVFDAFGRCRLDVERVLLDQHAGVWTMVVGLPGRIVTEEHRFVVEVKGADKKPEVLTSVDQSKPIVELTCSVISPEEKTGCLFRNPRGQVLVANQGVSENRYAFHINQTSSQAGKYHYSCGLQINDPVTSDLGLWRCDLESEEDIYFGFLTVLCPWAMLDPDVAASVVSEPVLTAQVESVSVAEGESVALACSARAALRYCYFRTPNGTLYNVGPGMSSPSVEYAGAGLDAGECGARLTGLLRSDNGTWSCHAGFHGGPEQFTRITVFVEEDLTIWSTREGARLVVEGRVAGEQQLDYCRFVRFDGFGFTSDRPPFPYIDESDLSSGLCKMQVTFSLLDLHPWTVVAKIRGRDGEISRVTRHNFPSIPAYTYNPLFMWLPFVLILSLTLVATAALAPAKNRRWASERASSLRSSLRRFPTFRKQPLADTNPAA